MHQPATRRLAVCATAVLVALGVAACSSDDGGDPLATLTDPPTTTTTTPPSTTTAPTTTSAPSTSNPPTTAAPSTTPSPVTTSVDDLKAQIAADVVAGYERMSSMLASPTIDGLDEWLATVAYPGSEFESLVRERVEYLVSVGDITIPDEPPINSMSVESVAIDDGNVGATLTVCQVDNLKTVTPAATSPVGEEIVSQEPQLAASRYTVHATRSGSAWLRDDYNTVYLGYYPGETACAGP